jgi:predicted methyltransferase
MSAPVIGASGRRPSPDATTPIYLSHYQATPLLRARKEGAARASTSVDLNLTMSVVALAADGIELADGRCVPWEAIEEAEANENAVLRLAGGALEKVQAFSELTGRVYTLYPTIGAPTMLVSGTPMHRIKGTNPYSDTLTKIKAITPVNGTVLDTTTGLGYTACQASRSASWVITIELDPAALEVARRNPWSAELFDSPKITQLIGDSVDVVPAFAGESFDAIIHDPPQFAMAGELYSGELYRHLHRVLRPGGKLFHYIGDPESRTGASTTRSATRRLQQAGFAKIVAHPEAFGVVAMK